MPQASMIAHPDIVNSKSIINASYGSGPKITIAIHNEHYWNIDGGYINKKHITNIITPRASDKACRVILTNKNCNRWEIRHQGNGISIQKI